MMLIQTKPSNLSRNLAALGLTALGTKSLFQFVSYFLYMNQIAVRHPTGSWAQAQLTPALAAIGAVAVMFAGFGLTRKSITFQVLARGVAFTLLISECGEAASSVTAQIVLRHMVQVGICAFALYKSRSMLETNEARSAFSPLTARKQFITGATATAWAGFTLLQNAPQLLYPENYAKCMFIAATLALLGASIALTKMRSWGILVPWMIAAIACVATISSWFVRGAPNHYAAIILVFSAIPSLLLARALLISRRMYQRNTQVPAKPSRCSLLPEQTTVKACPAALNPDEERSEPQHGELRPSTLPR